MYPQRSSQSEDTFAPSRPRGNPWERCSPGHQQKIRRLKTGIVFMVRQRTQRSSRRREDGVLIASMNWPRRVSTSFCRHLLDYSPEGVRVPCVVCERRTNNPEIFPGVTALTGVRLSAPRVPGVTDPKCRQEVKAGRARLIETHSCFLGPSFSLHEWCGEPTTDSPDTTIERGHRGGRQMVGVTTVVATQPDGTWHAAPTPLRAPAWRAYLYASCWSACSAVRLVSRSGSSAGLGLTA